MCTTDPSGSMFTVTSCTDDMTCVDSSILMTTSPCSFCGATGM